MRWPCRNIWTHPAQGTQHPLGGRTGGKGKKHSLLLWNLICCYSLDIDQGYYVNHAMSVLMDDMNVLEHKTMVLILVNKIKN